MVCTYLLGVSVNSGTQVSALCLEAKAHSRALLPVSQLGFQCPWGPVISNLCAFYFAPDLSKVSVMGVQLIKEMQR